MTLYLSLFSANDPFFAATTLEANPNQQRCMCTAPEEQTFGIELPEVNSLLAHGRPEFLSNVSDHTPPAVAGAFEAFLTVQKCCLHSVEAGPVALVGVSLSLDAIVQVLARQLLIRAVQPHE